MDAWPTFPGLEPTLEDKIIAARSELRVAAAEFVKAQIKVDGAGLRLDALLEERIKRRENGTGS